MTNIHENPFCEFNFNNKILILTIKKDIPNDIEWDWLKLTMNKFYENAEIDNIKFSIIFDIRLLGILPFKYYTEWANLFLQKKEQTQKYINKTSILVDSMLIKLSLNWFFSIYTTIRPMKFVDTIQDGILFVT
jgi:hypothetical protein